jgi:hypothetical protein
MQKRWFVLLMAAMGSFAGKASAGEKWASSNPKGDLGNRCEVHYGMPEGFVKSEELTAKQNALAILMRENGDRSRFIAIDFKPIKESAESFEGYRKVEIEFIKQYKVDVDVEVLEDGHFIKNEQQTIFEKWTSTAKSKFMVCKKVYRVKKPDGYYSISINAGNSELLSAYPFEEFLKGVTLACEAK